MINKKRNISIGIAAYNAEKNIEHMLNSLLSQKQTDFKLNKIIVHSDNSTDKTVKISRSFRNKKIIIIDNKNRRGFAGAFKFLMQNYKNDLLIVLNDDFQIKDKTFINKLVKPFIEDNQVGLVCGHVLPLEPQNFIEAAVVSSSNAYDKMRMYMKDGNNEYSCDGKILALSRNFINKYEFPKNLKEMGNVDAYTYFSCIKAGLKFRFVKDAIVYFRAPYTLDDLIKWFTRNNANVHMVRKRFGDIVDREYKKPPFLFWRCLFFEFIKNPFGCVFIFIISFYIARKSKKYAENFNPTWEVITTSKNYE